MKKKLTKHGNSYALVIDKPILELLDIDPETTPVEVNTDGESMMMTPVRDPKRAKKLRTAIEDMHKKYGKMLKRLAE